MQKLKLQNKWNKATNSFDKDKFELKDGENVITGKVAISSKIDGKWKSKAMSFIVFKSKASLETQNAVKSGQFFLADYNLSFSSFADKETGKNVEFWQIIINEAKLEGADKHSQAKANAYVADEEDDGLIPF